MAMEVTQEAPAKMAIKGIMVQEAAGAVEAAHHTSARGASGGSISSSSQLQSRNTIVLGSLEAAGAAGAAGVKAATVAKVVSRAVPVAGFSFETAGDVKFWETSSTRTPAGVVDAVERGALEV